MKLFYINNKSAVAFIFMVIFAFTKVNAVTEQNNSQTKNLYGMELYCKQMRSIRAELIENTPRLSVEYPIHLLAYVHCFTEHENLYFAAIKQAELELSNPVAWFNNKIQQAEKDAELECKKNKLTKEEFSVCKQDKYTELKNKHEAQKIIDIAKYLEKRQKIAKNLFNYCSKSLIDKITLLPHAIQLPLAWHIPTNRSITDLSFQDNGNNNDWLLSLQYRSYQEDLREILQQQCPGEMIYWVTINQEFDIANLYRSK